MTRAGWVFVLVGIAIAVIGTVQLPLTVALSGDPTINPVGNGILMWLSWGVGALLVLVGAVVALVGRLSDRRASP